MGYFPAYDSRHVDPNMRRSPLKNRDLSKHWRDKQYGESDQRSVFTPQFIAILIARLTINHQNWDVFTSMFRYKTRTSNKITRFFAQFPQSQTFSAMHFDYLDYFWLSDSRVSPRLIVPQLHLHEIPSRIPVDLIPGLMVTRPGKRLHNYGKIHHF